MVFPGTSILVPNYLPGHGWPHCSQYLRLFFSLTHELQLVLLASVLRPQGASLLDSELIQGLRESQREQSTTEGAEQEPMAPDQRDLGAGHEK